MGLYLEKGLIRLKNIPFGYDMVEGNIIVNKEEAKVIKDILNNYLSGMSMAKAAEAAGVTMTQKQVKRMIENRRYLGDDFYPSILTRAQVDAFEAERVKRENEYGGIRYRKSIDIRVATNFRFCREVNKYNNPIKQAEYIYSLIESEV